MSASLHLLPRPGLPRTRRAAHPAAPARPLRGPRSLFAKGLHDGRRAWLFAGVGLGLFTAFYAMSIATNYPSLASRREAIDSTQAVAAIGSMTGTPINAETLGGFLSWRVGNLLPLLLGAWSILALSGTLAGEFRAGSLEVLASAPLSRRRIATEKVAAHLAGLTIATALIGVLTWLASVAFARLPGDGIGLGASFVHFGAMALCGLAAGAIAFAAAPWFGRAAAAGFGAAALVAAYLVDAYGGTVTALGSVRGLSWFDWTASERPIAGSWDNASLVPVAILVAFFLALGVAGFDRRDVGATLRLPRARFPGRRLLLRGPARAAFLSTAPQALVWGLAIGLYAWLVGISAPGFVRQFASSPDAARLMDGFFPGIEWRTTGGMLQLIFFDLAVPFMALGAATLVGAIASDEHERRLDLVLATRLSRARWLAASAAGLLAAVALLTALVAAATAIGALQGGDDAVKPGLGVFVGGLYATALAGVGLAVLGLGRPGLAAAVTAALAIGFTTYELVGASLRLPAALLDLSPTRHLGRPMAGDYDWPGMLLAAGVAAGGVLLGAWGIRRRDISA